MPRSRAYDISVTLREVCRRLAVDLDDELAIEHHVALVDVVLMHLRWVGFEPDDAQGCLIHRERGVRLPRANGPRDGAETSEVGVAHVSGRARA